MPDPAVKAFFDDRLAGDDIAGVCTLRKGVICDGNIAKSSSPAFLDPSPASNSQNLSDYPLTASNYEKC
jgi:hypothetical protein